MLLRAQIIALLLISTLPALTQPPNTLTRKEKGPRGWHLLWDGKTHRRMAQRTWRDPFHLRGWVIKDGVLSTTDLGGKEGGDAGDIVTTRTFANYELSVDFRVTPGANSGILYLVDLDLKKGPRLPSRL